ncbi:hypothetical protein BJS_01751 [Bradyrhizobium japonicum SEMIA 5079]|nr:hypothetical protein BJS_01751 [Bradyrhizobium japonicum SEMIA 5079]
MIGTVSAAHVQAPKKPTARRSDGPGSLALPVPNTGDASSIQHIVAAGDDRQVNGAAPGRRPWPNSRHRRAGPARPKAALSLWPNLAVRPV